MKVTEAPILEESYVQGKKLAPYYCDAYEFKSNKSLDIIDTYVGIFGTIPRWITTLMRIRNVIARRLGFPAENSIQMSPPKESFKVGSKAGFLAIEHISSNEVVASATDKHMDLWISVMAAGDSVYRVSTLVNLRSSKGRLYMKVIKPFHKLVARKAIEHALKKNRV